MAKTLYILIIANQVHYDWALEIHNDPPADDALILAAFAALV